METQLCQGQLGWVEGGLALESEGLCILPGSPVFQLLDSRQVTYDL